MDSAAEPPGPPSSSDAALAFELQCRASLERCCPGDCVLDAAPGRMLNYAQGPAFTSHTRTHTHSDARARATHALSHAHTHARAHIDAHAQ